MKTRLAALLDNIQSSAVAIVGDIMLDEYIIGDSHRISPEAPEPVIEERERAYVPGGAANVAVNIVSLGGTARLVGVVGDDHDGTVFRSTLRASGVSDDSIVIDTARPTTRKTRLIARGNQVLRVDRETVAPVGGALLDTVVSRITGGEESVVVVSDYAKGVVTADLIKALAGTGKRIIVDPKTSDFSRYAGAYMVTPNHLELCRAAGQDLASDTGIEAAARDLMTRHNIETMLVTLGPEGMLLVESGGPATHTHTRAREVYDVTGAGDTVIACIAATAATGASLVDGCQLATIAAGIVVGKHRTATATPPEIMAYAFGPSASDKIVTLDTIMERITELKHAGRKIVFTNGCFDLLHVGHITYLNEARGLGDVLVVGLNTDDSVRRLKGPERPIIPGEERSHVLAALESVDFVVMFGEDTPHELIEAVRPDVLVKGADYEKEDVVGWDIVESYGGTVRLIPFVNNASTSDIIARIRKSPD